MSASDETLGSSNRAFLVFDIRPIEAEAKFQISCLNRPNFKKILNDAKQFNSPAPFTAFGFQ